MIEYTTIGRSMNSDIILGDPYISRNHARITRCGANYIMEDTSLNGTRINGMLLNHHTQDIIPGDRIMFSQHDGTYIFRVDENGHPFFARNKLQ